MFNLIKQLYKDFKLIYKINKITNPNIFPNIAYITILISNSYIISYNLTTKILYITFLHFIKKQYMIFGLFIILVK